MEVYSFMAKRLVWLAVSCLMVLSLVAASCTSDTSDTTTKDTDTGTEKVVVKETTTGTTTTPDIEEKIPVSTDEPEYGGTLSVVYGLDIMGFDSLTAPAYWDVAGHITHDTLLEGDWAKGPAGTGEFSWRTNDVYRWDSKAGAIAESFEIVEPGHLVFKIRQGIHYSVNPNSEASKLVNGRQLTAQDVVWNINRWKTGENSQIARSAPVMMQNLEVELVDSSTVSVKFPPSESIWAASYLVDWNALYPPEVIEKYGGHTEWQNSVGTGPYMITDYVRSSVISFKRNPNYWQLDPVGPGKGNQLPYVENVKYMIIADASTVESAIRTGQIDVQFNISIDALESITAHAPELIVAQYIPAAASSIAGNIQKTESPFSNLKVRQALTMAIDYQSIIDDLYHGKAELPSFPITPEPELANAYLTLDEAPQSVRELFTYNPTRAKELLTEAGYPSGFKTSIICTNPAVDYLSIVAAMWDQIGVTLEIEPVETGAYNSYWASRTFPDFLYGLQPSSGTYVRMLAIRGTSVGANLSFVDDPRVNEAKDKMWEAFAIGNQSEVDRVFKDLMPYVIEQCWAIQSPVPYVHTVWWPWLKNYHGEYSPGVCDEFRWAKYVWIDTDLKRSMGY